MVSVNGQWVARWGGRSHGMDDAFVVTTITSQASDSAYAQQLTHSVSLTHAHNLSCHHAVGYVHHVS